MLNINRQLQGITPPDKAFCLLSPNHGNNSSQSSCQYVVDSGVVGNVGTRTPAHIQKKFEFCYLPNMQTVANLNCKNQHVKGPMACYFMDAYSVSGPLIQYLKMFKKCSLGAELQPL